MKTYFTTREIHHQWAHQLAPYGKCPSHEEFRDGAFYSYNTAIARICEHRKKKFYLLNETHYSPSTSRHQSSVRRAIPSDAVVFELGGCGRGDTLDFGARTGKLLFEYAISKSAEHAAFGKRCRSQANKDFNAARQHHWLQEAERISKFFSLRRKVDEKAAERLAAAALRDHKRAQKEERERQAKLEAEEKERVQQWIAGDSVQFPYYIAKIYLRVANAYDDNPPSVTPNALMETSSGVTVPLADAEKAFRFCMLKREKGWRRNGEKFHVGEFQLDEVRHDYIIAGCHSIHWSEVERFANSQGWL